MVSHHGVLGHSGSRIQEFTYPWPPGALAVLHSDGVGTHWGLRRATPDSPAAIRP